MDNKPFFIPENVFPLVILGVPPLTGTDKRSYVATLSMHGSPKTSVCDVFNDLDMAVLLAAAPMLLEALRAAKTAIDSSLFERNVFIARDYDLISASNDIGTLLATIPAKF